MLLAAEVGAVFMIARTEAFPWLFTSLVRSLETSGPLRSLGRSGPGILAATVAEGVAFTVTSTAISLVLRAPMCQGRLWHIDSTQGIQSLCLVQTTTSAVVEDEDSTSMSMVTFQWLKPWFKAQCH